MTATNHDNDGQRLNNEGHSNDGHKKWPRSMSTTARGLSWFVAIIFVTVVSVAVTEHIMAILARGRHCRSPIKKFAD